uniref:Uncharacterized protein n=1 Tax=Coccidioides posadasii RMSCC 3488 TaxID=454284 RepID=A0A0J6FT37_COCPO|nr:hypothetical protein CPAG_08546 [Coccidioides posadasii RMSCC 3488]
MDIRIPPTDIDEETADYTFAKVTTAIILQSEHNWEQWLAQIRQYAQTQQIWEFIDPSVEEPPKLEPPEDGVDMELEGMALQKAMILLKREIKRYDRRELALADILNYIRERISSRCFTFIEDITCPHECLRILQEQVARPEAATRTMLRSEFMKMKVHGPPRGKDLEDWVRDWEIMVERIRKHKIEDLLYNESLVMDFLQAIQKDCPEFSTQQQLQITITEIYPSHDEVLRAFWRYWRNVQVNGKQKKFKQPGGSFAATLQGRSPAEEMGQERKGDSQKKPPSCVCGSKHYFGQCPYYNSNIRSADWKADPEIEKKAQEMLKKPRIKGMVKASIEREGKNKKTPTRELVKRLRP